MRTSLSKKIYYIFISIKSFFIIKNITFYKFNLLIFIFIKNIIFKTVKRYIKNIMCELIKCVRNTRESCS